MHYICNLSFIYNIHTYIFIYVILNDVVIIFKRTNPVPCHLRYGPQSCTISNIWWLRNAVSLSPTLDRLTHNLHFIRNSRWFVGIWSLSSTILGNSLWHEIDLLIHNPKWPPSLNLLSCHLVLKVKLSIVLIILIHQHQGPSETPLVPSVCSLSTWKDIYSLIYTCLFWDTIGETNLNSGLGAPRALHMSPPSNDQWLCSSEYSVRRSIIHVKCDWSQCKAIDSFTWLKV